MGRQIGGADYVDTPEPRSIAVGDKKESMMSDTPHSTHNLVISADSDVIATVRRETDKYFTRTRECFERFGNRNGLWAVYRRGPVIADSKAAIDYAVSFLNASGHSVVVTGPDGQNVFTPRQEKGQPVRFFVPQKDGSLVRGDGQPLFYYYGPGASVSELETGMLMRTLPPVDDPETAYRESIDNARRMVLALPHVAFIEMAARHCPVNSHERFAQAAAEGSALAKAEWAAKHPGQEIRGFIGTSTDQSAPLFGTSEGVGSMPHALINYAGSTLKAAQMFHTVHPDKPLTPLVDFFGREVSDSLELLQHFRHLAEEGRLAVRLDTHGRRYAEGLDDDLSHEIIATNAGHMFQRNMRNHEYETLIGRGVSVASVFNLRQQLDRQGGEQVKIFLSSGFNPEKCAVFAEAFRDDFAQGRRPFEMIGTGSYRPRDLDEFTAKSETLGFDDGQGVFQLRTKVGREWVGKKWLADSARHGWKLV